MIAAAQGAGLTEKAGRLSKRGYIMYMAIIALIFTGIAAFIVLKRKKKEDAEREVALALKAKKVAELEKREFQRSRIPESVLKFGDEYPQPYGELTLIKNNPDSILVSALKDQYKHPNPTPKGALGRLSRESERLASQFIYTDDKGLIIGDDWRINDAFVGGDTEIKVKDDCDGSACTFGESIMANFGVSPQDVFIILWNLLGTYGEDRADHLVCGVWIDSVMWIHDNNGKFRPIDTVHGKPIASRCINSSMWNIAL